MKKKRKDILVFEEDEENLKFLRAFFKTKNDYSARFIKGDKKVLKKELIDKKPSALVISSPEGLEHINPSEVNCPVIALISGNITRGIRSVVRSDVEYYLLSPFYKEDLEHKLKLALGRKSWFANLYSQRKDLDALIEFTYFISSTLNPEEVLYIFVKKISEMMKVARCSVISIEVGDQKHVYVISTSDDPEITKIRLELSKYPEIERAISIKKPVIIKDALKDPLMKRVRDIIAPLAVRSILVIPMIFRDEVIGTLLLRTTSIKRKFAEREIKLCTAIANSSANAFYNAFLYDKLDKEKKKFERLAVTDYLTGIYNIRYFYNRLDEEFSRAVRYNTPLSCMMLDIDHFKKINDTYGHRIGDIVLREFSQLVRGSVRKSDIFARYGGEEFIMLLPQTSLDGATDKARLIKRIVKEHQFMGIDEGYMVTVSIGIASNINEKIRTPDELISFADDALFTAKNEGRDQIVTYSQEISK
jgi:diguanylate cyclase (GGDEF)-like protein